MRGKACRILLVLALVAGTTGECRALEGLKAGDPPPPVSLPSLNGKIYTAEYFSGHVGTLVFWSTWSPRSAEILDDFKRHHEAYGPEGLRVLAVNVDGEGLTPEEQRQIREFAATRELPFPVLLDEKLETYVSYGVMAHPSAVVLSREGRVAYTLGGYPLSLREELETEIRKALGIYVPPPPKPAERQGGPGSAALQYYSMALSLIARDQGDRAVAILQKARESDPSFLDPLVMIARIHLAEDNLETAESFLLEADLSLVSRSDLRYIRGLLFLKKGDAEKAEKEFRALREESPGENWGYWGLAMVHLARGSYSKSLEELRAAPLPGESSPEVEAHVGRNLTARWAKGQAVEWETGFLELFPRLRETKRRYELMRGSQVLSGEEPGDRRISF